MSDSAKSDILDAVERLLGDPDALAEVAQLQETPLTLEDVIERVPWGRTKVLDMVKRRQIPMVKRGGRWIISRKKYRKALRCGFEAPKGARTLS